MPGTIYFNLNDGGGNGGAGATETEANTAPSNTGDPATDPVGAAGDTQPAPNVLELILPDDLDDSYAPFRGKTIADLLKSYNEARAEMKRAQAERAELKKKLSDTPSKPAEPDIDDGDDLGELQATEAWQKFFRAYFRDSATEEHLAELVQQTRLPPDHARTLAELAKKQRENFKEQVKDHLGEYQLEELEDWLASGKSPFLAGTADMFVQAANLGLTHWVKDVTQAYTTWLAKGNQRFVDGQQPTQYRPGIASNTIPDIYTSRSEYHQAITEAMRRGATEAEKRKIDEKMKRSLPFWT